MPPALRILALGDSYTIGEAVLAHQRWPVQLVAYLRGCGWPLADPEIIARTGWTTDELAGGLDLARPAGRYALVTLLIGVNNQYHGQSLDEYRAQFADLLARSIGLAGGEAGRVLVLSIPDWGVTPYAHATGCPAISAEIDSYNAANFIAAQQAGARYVDITPISRSAAHDLSFLAEDGLHPSVGMYAAWVTAMLPEVTALLSTP